MSHRRATRKFSAFRPARQMERETGSVTARPMGGRWPFALAAERKRLLEWITQQPDLPPRAPQAEQHVRGITVSYCAVWNIIGAVVLQLSFFRSQVGQRPRAFQWHSLATAWYMRRQKDQAKMGSRASPTVS